MVEAIVQEMMITVNTLKEATLQDIEDVKNANHENLLLRNDQKQALIEKIEYKKIELNKALAQKARAGEDINRYRSMVDELEENLNELHQLNQKLGMIVLPIYEMYQDMVSKFAQESEDGELISVRA